MRLGWLAALAIGVAAVLGAVGQDGSVTAAPVPIDLVATGAEENPPVATPHTAIVHFTWDSVTRQMTYAVTVSGLSPDQVTAAHIHRGARGSNGPVIYNLSTVGFTQVSGTLTIAESDVADLNAGNLYFNVHSKESPGGFARAQIPAQRVEAPSGTPLPSTPPAGGGNVAPPRAGDAGLAATNDEAASTLAGLAVLVAAMLGASVLVRRRV